MGSSSAALLHVRRRFVPRDDEAIVCLRRRIEGIPIYPRNHLIHEVDVYATEPFNLQSGYFVNGENDRKGFFFTERRPTTNNVDTRYVNRKAGSGTWIGKSKETTIKDPKTGRPIGHKNSFSFKLNHGHPSEWIMHEYSVDRKTRLTLCVIYSKKAMAKKCRARFEDEAPSFKKQTSQGQEYHDGLMNHPPIFHHPSSVTLQEDGPVEVQMEGVGEELPIVTIAGQQPQDDPTVWSALEPLGEDFSFNSNHLFTSLWPDDDFNNIGM